MERAWFAGKPMTDRLVHVETQPIGFGARWRDKLWFGYAMALDFATPIAAWVRWRLGDLLGGGIRAVHHLLPCRHHQFTSGRNGRRSGGDAAGGRAGGLFFSATDRLICNPNAGDTAALGIFIFTNLMMSLVGGAFRAGQRRTVQQAQQLGEDLQRLAQASELQRRSEQQLRLQAAMESAADAIVITNCQGNIQWANEAFSRLTGYRSARPWAKTRGY